MKSPLARWKNYFTEPVFPSFIWQLSRDSTAGIRFSRKDRKLGPYFIAPLPTGVVIPSFDRPNIPDASALEQVLRDGRAKLGADGGDISLLIPETCVRVFVLTFDALPSSPAEREELFRWRVAKLVPVDSSEMRLGYDVIKANGQAKVVLALGAGRVLEEYEAVFARAGLKVRTLSVPTLPLAGLVPRDEAGNALVVNSEDDHVSLLALLGGEASLYRVKPFFAEGTGPGEDSQRRDLVIREIETTMHFIEDKEKARISSVWIRPVFWPDGTVAELRKRWPSLRVAEFPGPRELRPAERRVLAPLIGQAS
jgi:hypothetical protein